MTIWVRWVMNKVAISPKTLAYQLGFPAVIFIGFI